jgi:RNA polymerase sigma-70 factor (ECF subfamily)
MDLVVAHSFPFNALVRPDAIRYSRRKGVCDRERPRGMRSETQSSAAPDAARWAELIDAIALHGNREAFAELFRYFAPRIKTLMLRSGASEQVADELAQEALLAVWSKAALFDPRSVGAAAWIFTIARNLRIDALRRQKRTPTNNTADVELEFQLDEGPPPDAGILAGQIEGRVRDAISALPDDQLRVIELSFFQEKAHAEIAGALGIPLGTVKSRLRLAMARLRSLLDDFS